MQFEWKSVWYVQLQYKPLQKFWQMTYVQKLCIQIGHAHFTFRCNQISLIDSTPNAPPPLSFDCTQYSEISLETQLPPETTCFERPQLSGAKLYFNTIEPVTRDPCLDRPHFLAEGAFFKKVSTVGFECIHIELQSFKIVDQCLSHKPQFSKGLEILNTGQQLDFATVLKNTLSFDFIKSFASHMEQIGDLSQTFLNLIFFKNSSSGVDPSSRLFPGLTLQGFHREAWLVAKVLNHLENQLKGFRISGTDTHIQRLRVVSDTQGSFLRKALSLSKEVQFSNPLGNNALCLSLSLGFC